MAMRHTGSVISKDHYQDWVGKDTPGVGEYSEKCYTDAGPKYSIIKDPRFYVPKKATHLADHAYHTPIKYENGTVVSQDTRWKYERDDQQRSAKAPGPGRYVAKSEFGEKKKIRNGFGKVTQLSTITYYKELQKAYTSLKTPGPGEYKTKSRFET